MRSSPRAPLRECWEQTFPYRKIQRFSGLNRAVGRKETHRAALRKPPFRSAGRRAEAGLQPDQEQLEDRGRFVLRCNADGRSKPYSWRIERIRRIICVNCWSHEDRYERDQSSALEYTSHKASFAGFRPAVREGALRSGVAERSDLYMKYLARARSAGGRTAGRVATRRGEGKHGPPPRPVS